MVARREGRNLALLDPVSVVIERSEKLFRGWKASKLFELPGDQYPVPKYSRSIMQNATGVPDSSAKRFGITGGNQAD